MGQIATRQAYGETLAKLGETNKDIVVLDADLSKSTMTTHFANKFPERFFNMGIAEQNLYGTSAGLSTIGKTVFASTFAIFAAGRAFEIIRNAICYSNLNVKICATHSGVTVGEDGGSHQAIEDIALMRVLPNMTVLCPSDAVSTEAAIKKAAEINGPVYVRLGRLAVDVLYNKEDFNFEIGKAITLRPGNDIAIIATGFMVHEALKAVELLAQKGIKARLIDMHTIKPLDKDIIIKAAKETGAIVTAEEHSVIGGLGSAVAEVLAENYPVKIKMVGLKDHFGESGKPLELIKKFKLTAEDIVEAAMQLKK